MSKRIKEITVRFNIEVRPFQHIRVETRATITKEDDQNEVRDELVAYAKTIVRDVESKIYRNENQEQSTQAVVPADNVPY